MSRGVTDEMVNAALKASRDKRLNTLTNSNAMRFILEATLAAELGAAEDMVLVPKAALDWLNGEGPDPAGFWFGDFPDDHPKPPGAFWWRTVFSDMCRFYAAPQPLESSK